MIALNDAKEKQMMDDAAVAAAQAIAKIIQDALGIKDGKCAKRYFGGIPMLNLKHIAWEYLKLEMASHKEKA